LSESALRDSDNERRTARCEGRWTWRRGSTLARVEISAHRPRDARESARCRSRRSVTPTMRAARHVAWKGDPGRSRSMLARTEIAALPGRSGCGRQTEADSVDRRSASDSRTPETTDI